MKSRAMAFPITLAILTAALSSPAMSHGGQGMGCGHGMMGGGMQSGPGMSGYGMMGGGQHGGPGGMMGHHGMMGHGMGGGQGMMGGGMHGGHGMMGGGQSGMMGQGMMGQMGHMHGGMEMGGHGMMGGMSRGQGGQGMMGPSMMGGGMPGGQGAGMVDRIEGRLAFLKTELKITDAQTPQWNKLADAIRTSAKSMRERMQTRQSGGQPAATLPERIERHEQFMTARLDEIKQVKGALNELYASLTEDQKREANNLVPQLMGIESPAIGSSTAGSGTQHH